MCCFSAGTFGDTPSPNFLEVKFTYALFTNSTFFSKSTDSISSVVEDIEVSVTNLLLPTLFSSCATYNPTSSNRSSSLLNEQYLQVLGISGQPDDIVLNGTPYLLILNLGNISPTNAALSF